MLTSVVSASLMEHAHTHTRIYKASPQLRDCSTGCTRGDKSHYYLCTLIKGEGKLFINHGSPRGQGNVGRVKGEDRMGAKEPGTSGPHISQGPSSARISKRLVHHSRGTRAWAVVTLGSV